MVQHKNHIVSRCLKIGISALATQIAIGCVALPGSKLATPIAGASDPKELLVHKDKDGETVGPIHAGLTRADVHAILKDVDKTEVDRDLGRAEIYELPSSGKVFWLVPEPQNSNVGVSHVCVDNLLWVEYDYRDVVTSVSLDQNYGKVRHVIAPPW